MATGEKKLKQEKATVTAESIREAMSKVYWFPLPEITINFISSKTNFLKQTEAIKAETKKAEDELLSTPDRDIRYLKLEEQIASISKIAAKNNIERKSEIEHLEKVISSFSNPKITEPESDEIKSSSFVPEYSVVFGDFELPSFSKENPMKTVTKTSIELGFVFACALYIGVIFITCTYTPDFLTINIALRVLPMFAMVQLMFWWVDTKANALNPIWRGIGHIPIAASFLLLQPLFNEGNWAIALAALPIILNLLCSYNLVSRMEKPWGSLPQS